jgi:hypothetical protein
VFNGVAIGILSAMECEEISGCGKVDIRINSGSWDWTEVLGGCYFPVLTAFEILRPRLLCKGDSPMHTPNEIAAAILVQTLVDHHPSLQAEIRQDLPDPKQLAQVLVPFYNAMLDEMKSPSV